MQASFDLQRARYEQMAACERVRAAKDSRSIFGDMSAFLSNKTVRASLAGFDLILTGRGIGTGGGPCDCDSATAAHCCANESGRATATGGDIAELVASVGGERNARTTDVPVRAIVILSFCVAGWGTRPCGSGKSDLIGVFCSHDDTQPIVTLLHFPPSTADHSPSRFVSPVRAVCAVIWWNA
jgi:hypothetical protein